MRKFLAACALVVLSACASVGTSVNGQLVTAYQTVSAYVDVTKNALVRGRISPAQAEKASANAKKASATIDQAKVALQGCKEQFPCDTYTDLLKSLQPTLLEFELELRRQEGK